MPKKAFPKNKDDYTPKIKKKLQEFIQKADEAVAKEGRYLWFTDNFKVIGRSNYPKQAKAEAVKYLTEHRSTNWEGRWIMYVRFRMWKGWKNIFDKDRGPLEIQTLRYKIAKYNEKREKYPIYQSQDSTSFICMFYHPHEAHMFKLKHLKLMARAVHTGTYGERIVNTYNAKDFAFIK